MSLEHGRVLNTGQAATYVGLAPSTMAKLRLSGNGPVYSKLGRRVGYTTENLDSWLEINQRRSTSAGNDGRLTAGERLKLGHAARPIATPSAPFDRGNMEGS